MVVLCVVALLAVAGLVAVVAGVTGGTSPAATPAPVAAPAQTIVGDARTADPCSLLTESSMRRFGETTTLPDSAWPNGCAIQLASEGPGYLTVSATLALSDPVRPPDGTPTPTGDLTVYRETAEKDQCGRTVSTRDGTLVYVWAQSWEGGKGDLCAIAEAGTDTAVSAMSVGQLPRRTTVEPANSLALSDVCEIVDAGAVGRAAGVDTSLRQPGFGNWACYWGSDPAFSASPAVDVDIERYGRLTGTPTKIGGRAAQVTPSTEAGDTTCTVALVHRSYASPEGYPRVEVLTIRAYAGRQPNADASCRNARAVAEAAAPRMPPAS